MRMTAVVAAIASCAIIFAHSAKADALSPVELAFEQQTPTLLEELAQDNEQIEGEAATELQEEPKPVTYIVSSGDSLSSIAKEHDTTWTKMFYKNTEIKHPDLLKIGQKLLIPDVDEELEERELPKPQVPKVTPVNNNRSIRNNTTSRTSNTARTSNRATQSAARVRSAPTAGNSYSYGYCTWYVKNLRPDLPNNLGNADTWAGRAASQGFATGSTPRVGAVAQALTGYMHVAYVQAVHGDGTITVTEMNFKGWSVVSSRRVAASSFVYIY